MGQTLMNPPTVEGWHTGHEWIDGGTLNERVNFAVNQFNGTSAPGVQDIISGWLSEDGSLSPEALRGTLSRPGWSHGPWARIR